MGECSLVLIVDVEGNVAESNARSSSDNVRGLVKVNVVEALHVNNDMSVFSTNSMVSVTMTTGTSRHRKLVFDSASNRVLSKLAIFRFRDEQWNIPGVEERSWGKLTQQA